MLCIISIVWVLPRLPRRCETARWQMSFRRQLPLRRMTCQCTMATARTASISRGGSAFSQGSLACMGFGPSDQFLLLRGFHIGLRGKQQADAWKWRRCAVGRVASRVASQSRGNAVYLISCDIIKTKYHKELYRRMAITMASLIFNRWQYSSLNLLWQESAVEHKLKDR